MFDRRRALTAGGLALGVLGVPRLLSPEAHGRQAVHHAGLSAAAGTAAAPAIQPFTRPMPVAPVSRPVLSTREFDLHRIQIKATTAEILPGVRTPVLGYGGQFVGPTIRARTGKRVLVAFTNQLTEGANVHLHGGRTPAEHDGHPSDIIAPGGARLYSYPNAQQGATLWYHDHSHHTEADHVFRGLHGAYVVEDESERHLRLPSGAFDVPIMLRDIQFDDAGNLVVFDDPARRTTVLANGVPQPHHEVAARKYRLRLVNTSNARIFRLALDNAKIVQVGTDGGLLPRPVELDELELVPGERADLVVDFARHPLGSHLVLSDATAGPVLRFDITRRATDDSRLPDELRPLPPLPRASVERDVDMAYDFDVPAGSHPNGVVNGRMFDENRVDFTVKRGTSEIWTVRSSDPVGMQHSFHLHLAQFRVLDRGGKPPVGGETGLKDTIRVTAGEAVRVRAAFGGYTGRYVFHCHHLEHSWIGMMAQLEVVP